MKHISNFLRSKSWNVFLFLYLALPLFAQKEYKIDQVSVVNVGDGRLLFQELKTEKSIEWRTSHHRWLSFRLCAGIF